VRAVEKRLREVLAKLNLMISEEKNRTVNLSKGESFCFLVVTLADALAHRENLRKNPDFDPSFSQLVDLSHVTKIEFSREDVEPFAQDTIFSPDSRRAALAAGDHAYGLARMFEMLREFKGEEGVRAFRNLDEALDWVLSKNTAV
jgi:hypothetical protein